MDKFFALTEGNAFDDSAEFYAHYGKQEWYFLPILPIRFRRYCCHSSQTMANLAKNSFCNWRHWRQVRQRSLKRWHEIMCCVVKVENRGVFCRNLQKILTTKTTWRQPYLIFFLTNGNGVLIKLRNNLWLSFSSFLSNFSIHGENTYILIGNFYHLCSTVAGFTPKIGDGNPSAVAANQNH